MRHSLTRLTAAAVLMLVLPVAKGDPPESSVPGVVRSDGARESARDLTRESSMPSNVGSGQPSVISLSASRVALEPALAADLRCRVSAFDQQLVGAGHYVQVASPSGPLVRLELRIGLGDEVVSWLEVRGPQSYWLRRHIPPAPPVLGRVDLRQVRRQAYDSQDPPPGPETWILAGGIPHLLGALDAHFDFDPLRQDELRFQPAPGESVARLPVWIVRGRWKPSYRTQLAGSQEKKENLRLLPQVPEEVELVLGGQQTPFPLFPYRITFWQQGPPGRPADRAPAWRELFSLEFFHVSRHVPSDPGLFDYEPGDQEVENLTPAYVQRLQRRAIQR